MPPRIPEAQPRKRRQTGRLTLAFRALQTAWGVVRPVWSWRQVRFLILLGQYTPLGGPQVTPEQGQVQPWQLAWRSSLLSQAGLSWFLGASRWGRAWGVSVLRRKARPHGKPAMGR